MVLGLKGGSVPQREFGECVQLRYMVCKRYCAHLDY